MKAIVSPPIFVDSRKSVRESEKFSVKWIREYRELKGYVAIRGIIVINEHLL